MTTIATETTSTAPNSGYGQTTRRPVTAGMAIAFAIFAGTLATSMLAAGHHGGQTQRAYIGETEKN